MVPHHFQKSSQHFKHGFPCFVVSHHCLSLVSFRITLENPPQRERETKRCAIPQKYNTCFSQHVHIFAHEVVSAWYAYLCLFPIFTLQTQLQEAYPISPEWLTCPSFVLPGFFLYLAVKISMPCCSFSYFYDFPTRV